jgi:LDH2 family malate/lactate/ureidoglycolate dehydrogenase
MNPVPVAELRTFVQQVFQRTGLSAADAEIATDVLVTTDTWGVFTHGTKLVYLYTRRLRGKGLSPQGRPRVEREGPAWALVDADSAMGSVSSVFAMELAIAKAATAGVAYVVVHRSCHFGAAGYYAAMAASRGMVGMVMSNDVPSVGAPGSLVPILGSNPFAFAAASDTQGSMVLDMATAAVAGGKVAAAAAEGKSIPEGWLFDKEGNTTTDPNLFAKQQGAFLAPMAGPKGYGLALMIEILSAAVSGSAMRDKVGMWAHQPTSINTDHSHGFLVINPAVFLGSDAFAGRLDDLFAGIRREPATAASGGIKIPGQIESQKQQEALEKGIQFPDEVIRMLRVAAEENQVPLPTFLS